MGVGGYQFLSLNKLKGFRSNSIRTQSEPIDISPITTPQISNKHSPLTITKHLCMIPTQHLGIKQQIIEFRRHFTRINHPPHPHGGCLWRWNLDYATFTFIVLGVEDEVDFLRTSRGVR